MKFHAFAFLAGILAAMGFEPAGLWPLAIAALAALLWLVEEAPSLRSALARGWWFGFGHFALGLNWIATAFTYQSEMPSSLGWAAVLLLSFYLACYPAMVGGLAWRWGAARTGGAGESEPGGREGTLSFVLLFAAAWIVGEWLRAGLFTGFAWNPLGVVLLPTFVSRLAIWFGTYGLSGVTIVLAGGLVLLLRRRWLAGGALVGTSMAAGLLAMLPGAPSAGPPGAAVRIVQPNIGQQEKWQEGFERQGKARLHRLSARSRAGPRLLLWPEAAVTRPLENGLGDPVYRIDAADLRREVGAMLGANDLLLTGGITWRSADGVDVTSATNSVFAIDPAGRVLGRYDKAHLVPFGEYLPMRPLLSRLGLSRLAPGDIDFDPGPGPRTLDLPLFGRVGIQLCYEIVFSGEVVDREHRPDFLFNPSNDAWFGAWGPPQHLAQARLRALEEGLPVLRSTPTGISAIVDADGRLLHSLAWRREGVIDARLPAPRPSTLFARFGNFMPLLLSLILATLAIAVSRKAR